VISLIYSTRNQKKKLKQTNASAHLVQYRFKIRGGSPEDMEERMCKRDEF